MQVDPLERYGNRHRLLALDLDLPAELLQKAGPPEDSDHDLRRMEALGHLNLVQHQAAQVQLLSWHRKLTSLKCELYGLLMSDACKGRPESKQEHAAIGFFMKIPLLLR